MKILSQSTVKHKLQRPLHQISACGLYVAILKNECSAYAGIAISDAAFEIQRKRVADLQHILDAAATIHTKRTVGQHQIAYGDASVLQPWNVAFPLSLIWRRDGFQVSMCTDAVRLCATYQR